MMNQSFDDYLNNRKINTVTVQKEPEKRQSATNQSYLGSKRTFELNLFSSRESMSAANETCVKMCYNPNAEKLINASKDDGAVEVYGCQHNCMTKMLTSMKLFDNFAASHPRFIKRNEELKQGREEFRNSLFFYGSMDHQNL